MKRIHLKRILSALLTASLLLAISGCSHNPVQKDYDSQADFSSIRSLHWLSPEKIANPKIAQFRNEHSLMASRVRNAIARDLQTKRLLLNALPANAYIGFYINQQKHMVPDPLSVHYGFGRGYRFGGIWFESAPDYIEEISTDLVIEIYNPQLRVIWQAQAPFNIQADALPEEKDRQIYRLVQQMLQDFPPKKTP